MSRRCWRGWACMIAACPPAARPRVARASRSDACRHRARRSPRIPLRTVATAPTAGRATVTIAAAPKSPLWSNASPNSARRAANRRSSLESSPRLPLGETARSHAARDCQLRLCRRHRRPDRLGQRAMPPPMVIGTRPVRAASAAGWQARRGQAWPAPSPAASRSPRGDISLSGAPAIAGEWLIDAAAALQRGRPFHRLFRAPAPCRRRRGAAQRPRSARGRPHPPTAARIAHAGHRQCRAMPR